MTAFDPSITSGLYDSIVDVEDARLTTYPMERELTMDTILSYLPAEPAQIADIGGATGGYAFPLAAQGHEVHLRDLSPALISRATERQGMASAPLASIAVGNALHRLFEGHEGTFDAVLLLGPCYHICDAEERVQAIKLALSLLKSKTGVLFCAFISKLAHLRDLAQREPDRLVNEWEFYEKYLEDGRYVKDSKTRGRRVQSYHISFEEIHPLIEKAGGRVEEVVSVEGILPGGLDSKLRDVDPVTLKRWVNVVKPLARKAENLGCADHWLVVIRKDDRED